MFLRSYKIVCKKQIYRYYLFIGSNCQAQISSPIFGLLQVVYWSVTLRKEFYWLDLLGIQMNNCCDARQFANVSTGTLVSTGRKKQDSGEPWIDWLDSWTIISLKDGPIFILRGGGVGCVCVCVWVKGGGGRSSNFLGHGIFFSHPKVAQIFLLNIKIGFSL